jgi:hypothetical protein
MKVRTVAWVTCAAMIASCAFVYTITPPGGAHTNTLERENFQSQLNASSTSPAQFAGGTTLKMDARLGYHRLPRAGARENLLLVQVAATDDVGEALRLPTSTALLKSA